MTLVVVLLEGDVMGVESELTGSLPSCSDGGMDKFFKE